MFRRSPSPSASRSSPLRSFEAGFDETLASVSRLGFAFPALLLPGACWHLLRTWGWSIAFPDETRPRFAHLFRVRLAADAISFFTIRGVTGEPLKVMLLYDQVAAPVAAAAITLERLAFAIMSLVIAGVISTVAVRLLAMPGAWDAIFTLLSMTTVIALAIVAEIARHRKGDYLGRLVTRLGRLLGRPLETSRVVRFILDVEDVLLDLLRGDRRRLIILTILPVVCYLLTAFEVWLVLWADRSSQSASRRRWRSIRSPGSAAWPLPRFRRASAPLKRRMRRQWRCWGWVAAACWR